MSQIQKRQGKVVRWDADKRYGFLRPDGAIDNLFFHANSIWPPRADDPKAGEACEFEIGTGRDGRACAINVRFG